MFFDTEQKAKDYLSTLDSREYYRWIEKYTLEYHRYGNIIWIEKYQSITKNKCDTEIEITSTEEEEIERDRERELIKEVEGDLKENNPQYAIK